MFFPFIPGFCEAVVLFFYPRCRVVLDKVDFFQLAVVWLYFGWVLRPPASSKTGSLGLISRKAFLTTMTDSRNRPGKSEGRTKRLHRQINKCEKHYVRLTVLFAIVVNLVAADFDLLFLV